MSLDALGISSLHACSKGCPELDTFAWFGAQGIAGFTMSVGLNTFVAAESMSPANDGGQTSQNVLAIKVHAHERGPYSPSRFLAAVLL
jgi:hypothetical protein